MMIDPTSRSDGYGDGDRDGDGYGDGHGDGRSGDDEHGTGHSVDLSGTTIEEVYDKFADSYQVRTEETRIRGFQREMLNKFPHHGFTLDLGCGAGPVGRLIRESFLNSALVDSNTNRTKVSKQAEVYVHGVDISTNMLKQPWCIRYYDSTQHGFIQDVLLDPSADWMEHTVINGREQNPTLSESMVDHITCFGALHFLNPTEFEAVLSRMFALARRSVMFDIDDLCPMYINYLLEKHGEGLRNYNHVAAYRKFGTPLGWTKVVEEESMIYHSPSVGIDVRGILVRFEQVD